MAKTKEEKESAKKEKKSAKRSNKLKLKSAGVSLTVNDLDKSIEWYRDVLGFTLKEKWERDGKVLGVEMRAADVSFMLAQDDWKKGKDRKKGEGFRVYCMTKQNIDKIAQRAKDAGATLDHEPQDEPWGSRTFAISDPDGFKITIGTE